MLVPLTHIDPLVLAPVVIGILTLFGRKKKEEKVEETKPHQSAGFPPISPSKTANPMDAKKGALSPSFPSRTSGPIDANRGAVSPFPEIEDTPLSKLLQTLLQDIPLSQSSTGKDEARVPPSTPDWVPLRATPPSRPMVIVPGDKGKKLVDSEEAVPPKIAQKPAEPSEITPPIPSNQVEPAPLPPPSKFEGLEDEVKKLEEEVKKKLESPEKLEKAVREEKQEKKALEKVPAGKDGRGFEHAFQLTQGALKSPGLVVVSGPQGSGKTSLSSGLASAYLQQGSPCLLVTYDSSPSEAREGMRKVNCDPSTYESQFRFLLIDGFSAQSEAFSMEPYYVERPFDLISLQETLVRNTQFFMGDRISIILDSLDGFLSRVSAKEFLKGLREIADKLKESGATFVVTVDSEKLSKDFAGPLEDMADCVIDLEKHGSNGGRFRVRKLNGSATKSDPEPFEFDSAKGLVFV